MKTRRNKILGIALSLALLLQGIAMPVSAMQTPDNVSSDLVSSDIDDTTPADLSVELDDSTAPSESESLISESSSESPTTIVESTPPETPTTSSTTVESGGTVETAMPSADAVDTVATESESEDTEAPAATPTAVPEPATSETSTTVSSGSESSEADETAETEHQTDPNEGEGGLTAAKPIIGPMFIGLDLIVPTAFRSQAANDSGVELNKTATYNPATNSVDFRFDVFSTGELATIVSTKPTDIILVLDQSSSMNESFGQGTRYTLWVRSGTSRDQNEYLNTNRTNLFIQEGGIYYPVTVTTTGSGVNTSYTYSYTVSGSTTSETGINRNSPVPDWPFYIRSTQTVSRRQALVDATTAFINAVTAKAIEGDENGDPIPHRISMVGFSNPFIQSYSATEILTVTGSSSIGYLAINDTNRAESLLDTSTTAGQQGLSEAVSRLRTGTYTSTDLGMEMARDILSATASTSTDRDRIVVMLTDGVPTYPYSGSFNDGVANRAIGFSKNIKDAGHQVFTIGIFPGADNGSLPASSSSETQRANRFMHLVSSNYPNATSMTATGTGGSISNGFYFDDSDPEGLIETFRTISEQVGSTNEALTAQTIMKDILIPQLNLPLVSGVTFTTAEFNGFDAGDNYSWRPEASVTGVSASLNETDHSVNVTGFSYKDNYVAMDETTNLARGKKLIIRFSAAVAPDFIGGNVIYPNLTGSGIYLPGQSTVFEEFNRPEVDIPLRFDFETNPRSIYLTNSTEPWNLLKTDGGKYLINGTEYSKNGENNEYADIVYTISSADGSTIFGTYTVLAGAASGTWSGTDVSPDSKTAYRITAVVTATSAGTHAPLTAGPRQDFIHVYTPVVTAADASLYLTQQTDLANRMTVTNWTTLDPTAPAPMGTAPTVTLNPIHTSGTSPIGNGGTASYAPLEDSFFDVEVKIGTRDITLQSTIIPSSTATALGYDFGIFVFYPKAKGSDTTIWLGETTDLADQMSADGWFNDAGAPTPPATAPSLTLNSIFVSGTDPTGNGGTAAFSGKVDSRFNIQVLIGTEDVSSYARIAASPDGLINGNHFTVFVLSGSLTIKKEAADGTSFDPNQSFIFEVEGPNGESWTIAIQGEDERTISGLSIGEYSISENTEWSWRYEPDEAVKSATISSGLGNAHRSVTFTNSKEDDQWLSGEAFAINTFERVADRVAGVILAVIKRIGG